MTGEVGEERNAIVWWIISICTCGLGAIFWMMKVSNEVNARLPEDKQVPAGWLIIIPLYGLLVQYKIFEGIKNMQEVDGVPECDRVNPIMLFVLTFVMGISVILSQNALNAHWQKLSA